MLGRFPHAQLSTCVRSRNKSASLTLSLPHSDLSFVESDSDGEWSETRRRPESSKARPAPRRKPPAQDNEQTQEQDRETKERNDNPRGIQFAVASGISFLLRTQAGDLTMKLLWLSVFHSAASQPARMFEYSTLIGPAVVPVCTLVTRSKSKSELPHQVRAVAEFLKGCRGPAMISILIQMLRGLAGQRPLMRNRNQDMMLSQLQQGGQLRDSVAAMSPSIEDLYQTVRARSPSNTADYAEIYKSVIYLFKLTLDWHPIETSRRFIVRFDDSDTEVMRYLMASHLLDARSEEDVEEVFTRASRRLQETLLWANSYQFVAERAIKNHWFDLVRWTRRTESGYPILLIRLGAAIRICEGDKADEYGRAIITQVDRGVRKLLKNDGIDSLIALVDCEGASAVNVNRFYNLLRNVPITLNKHYPGRLNMLYLVNVPTFVIWLVLLVKRFLHPVTREKICVHGNLNSVPEELIDVINNNNERHNSATEGTSEVH